MTAQAESFDAGAVRGLLSRIGAGMADRGLVAEVALHGGSALLFVMDVRAATRDVDYVLLSGSPRDLGAVARRVGTDSGLTEGWFSDAVRDCASDVPDHRLLGDFPPDRPGLRVFTASPDYMLAMKLMAMRSSLETHDVEDVWNLLDRCGIEDEEGALEVVDRFFPGKSLPRRNALILGDVIEAKAAGRPYSRELGW